MIPKIIHYCWFGHNPLPPLALECIASWRKFLPDYEIKEWNEDNFDVNIIPYTAEAYRLKKYAFVSDYARFWVLYHYGGIYFDTDVEVIRPIDVIIARGNFMGFEMNPDGKNSPGRYAPQYCFAVNPGVGLGFTPKHAFIKKMLDIYQDLVFLGTSMSPWLETVVTYTTRALIEDGLCNMKGIQQVGDITIYPSEYFAPIDFISRRLHITKNTFTIHQYMGSWSTSKKRSVKATFRKYIPEWALYMYNKIKRRKYRIR